jgi:cytosine/adenosine deaminase-related metal-dependent hydrolase
MLPYAFTILVLVIITQRRIIVSSPDPVSAIVCAASGADVDTVVIDGKIVVQSGAVSAVPR